MGGGERERKRGRGGERDLEKEMGRERERDREGEREWGDRGIRRAIGRESFGGREIGRSVIGTEKEDVGTVKSTQKMKRANK